MNLLWTIINGVFIFLFKQVLSVFNHISFGSVSFLSFMFATVFVALIIKIFLSVDITSIKDENDDGKGKLTYSFNVGNFRRISKYKTK